MRLPHRHGQPRSNEVALFLPPPHIPWSFPRSRLYFTPSYALLFLPFDIFLALVSFLFSSHCSDLLSHLPLTQPTLFALSAHGCAFPQLWPPPFPEGYGECILFTAQREETPLLHRSRKRINTLLSHAGAKLWYPMNDEEKRLLHSSSTTWKRVTVSMEKGMAASTQCLKRERCFANNYEHGKCAIVILAILGTLE